MNKWQAGYYAQSGTEIVWKDLDARNRQSAMRQADDWIAEFTKDNHPWSMVVIALESAKNITALRYLDETEWVLSGKGRTVQLQHKLVR